jgi:hypothetical protein
MVAGLRYRQVGGARHPSPLGERAGERGSERESFEIRATTNGRPHAPAVAQRRSDTNDEEPKWS